MPQVAGTRAAIAPAVVLDLSADEFRGTGYAYMFRPREAEAIGVLIADLAETVLGRPVQPVRRHWLDLYARLNHVGQTGLAVAALATVDTALWDLAAQFAGVPLYQMPGGVRYRVPVYFSGGWLSYSTELVEEVLQARDRGFGHYKMKVGHSDWALDVARVEAVLAAAGDSLQIMVDANQAWDAPTAIRAGRALQALGVDWLEEPVDAHDIDACARVNSALDMRVATGESLFTRREFRPLIERRAADVIMPDLMRCGGPSEFMNVAVLADSFGLSVSSHLFTEVSAHLIAASPNGGLVEYIPGWFDDLFSPGLEFIDGELHLPAVAGAGFRLCEETLRARSAADSQQLKVP